MPKDQRKRLLKIMKKRRKEKAKQKQRNRAAQGGGETTLIRRAREFPLYECVVNTGWREGGLANIITARALPDSRVIAACFLVDLGCLGVKNTYATRPLSKSEYAEFKEQFAEGNEGADVCSAALAHQIIYEGLDFAKKIGFKPHKDFALTQNFLEPRDTFSFEHDIPFGIEGKPHYISGPHDNVNRILSHLDKTLGPGNYFYTVAMPDDDTVDEEDYDEELGETY